MEEVHSSTTTNPTKQMFFPHSTNQQLITDMANSVQETIRLTPDRRHGELNDLHGRRIHELMRFRSHTVDTDGF